MEGGRQVQVVVLRQLRGGIAEAAIEDERAGFVDDEERLQTHLNIIRDPAEMVAGITLFSFFFFYGL